LKTQSANKAARRYTVSGRVQGVGFRAFAQNAADAVGVCGWAANRDDGSVEVYAVGTNEQLLEFSGYIRKGPRQADVRHVDEKEAAVEDCIDFDIRY
jgi:acylphosphatase